MKCPWCSAKMMRAVGRHICENGRCLMHYIDRDSPILIIWETLDPCSHAASVNHIDGWLVCGRREAFR